MKKQENKVAVITGGNSGIGFGIADELIAQGATIKCMILTILYRNLSIAKSKARNKK